MKTLFLASNNPKKQKEFEALLKPYYHFKVPNDLAQYIEPEETAETFLENALLKARYGAKLSQLPCLADDSGLCVPALNGAPGVYSARYAEKNNDAANNQKLITEIKKIEETKRQGFFVCVLVLVQHEHDPMPLVFQGLWQGRILTELRGNNGFGYDPLFYLPEFKQSAAEIDPALKNKISHRGQAMQALLSFLEKYKF